MVYKLTLVTASPYKKVVRSKFVSDVSIKSGINSEVICLMSKAI